MSASSPDPVERALGHAIPRVRRLRLVLIAILVVVLVAKALGFIDPSWQVILWLTTAVAVLPPLVVALTTARHLEEPSQD